MCFVIIRSYPFFIGIRGSVAHFFRAWGNTTHFQHELKETVVIFRLGGREMNQSVRVFIFPFSALTLLVGRLEGHPASCSKLGVGLLTVTI